MGIALYISASPGRMQDLAGHSQTWKTPWTLGERRWEGAKEKGQPWEMFQSQKVVKGL